MTDTLHPPRRRGFFTRLAEWWLRRRRPAVPNPAPLPAPTVPTRYAVNEGPFTVPTYADAFVFQLSLAVTWSSKTMAETDVRERTTASLTEAAHRDTLARVRGIGRKYHGHQAAAAEKEMNEALERSWCYDVDGHEIQCSVRVAVLTDERVTERQREQWFRFIELDTEREVALHRIEHLREVFTAWQELLDSLGGAITVPYAAELTGHQDFARAVAALVREERSSTEELVAVLESAVFGHNRLGLYEYVTTYESALKVWQRRMNLDVLPNGSER